MTPKTLLLVEDDPDLRLVMRILLLDEGYEVRVAEHGAAALALLERGLLPDVILLDLMMPVMDGWAFHERFAQEPAWRGIPVLVLTASHRPGPAGLTCLA